MNDIVITPDIERCMQANDTLHDSLTAHSGNDVKVSLQNAFPMSIPQLEEKNNVTARINTIQSDHITRKAYVLPEYTAANRLK